MRRFGLLLACLLLALPGCLRRTGPDPVEMAHLIRELDSPDWRVSTRAAERLMLMGPAAEPAVPALIRQLGPGGPRQMQNLAAANALARIGPRAALPALAEAIGGKDPDIAYGAIWTLGMYGRAARAARPAILTALEDPRLQSVADRVLRVIDGEK
ncbi:MAG: HEAT repeat domain-containing protein [Deltaproteobacteria bacterium]|nr:HEAT repeat domain-containing protein [Deltaproteobacteria bacterium]